MKHRRLGSGDSKYWYSVLVLLHCNSTVTWNPAKDKHWFGSRLIRNSSIEASDIVMTSGAKLNITEVTTLNSVSSLITLNSNDSMVISNSVINSSSGIMINSNTSGNIEF